ncbi:hypothetical protein TWF718_005859 [Orbilia javanica]|uniref:Uncharacterized protein n=1 Tax=Orbilia javanica TaxID=47235 RepID=A0AAN8RJD2_9PEZI
MKYSFKARKRKALRPAMSYREFLKWQEAFTEKTDAVRLKASIRDNPIIRQFALPHPQNPRDWSFKPHGETEIIQRWDLKEDKQRRIALRLMKVFLVLYKRDEEYEMGKGRIRRLQLTYQKWRFVIFLHPLIPYIGPLLAPILVDRDIVLEANNASKSLTRLFIFIAFIMPAITSAGIFAFYLIFMYNFCSMFSYVYWDWTLSPELMYKPGIN